MSLPRSSVLPPLSDISSHSPLLLLPDTGSISFLSFSTLPVFQMYDSWLQRCDWDMNILQEPNIIFREKRKLGDGKKRKKWGDCGKEWWEWKGVELNETEHVGYREEMIHSVFLLSHFHHVTVKLPDVVTATWQVRATDTTWKNDWQVLRFFFSLSVQPNDRGR